MSVARSEWVAAEKIVGHRQVTDAHLLALAIGRGGRLATFDRGVTGVVPPGKNAEDVIHFLS